MSVPQSKYPPSKARSKRKPRTQSKPAEESKSLAQSRITAQGQISVPAEVRRKLGIGPGTVLAWEVKDGTAVVRKVGKYTFEDMHRRLFPDGPPPYHTLEELKQGIADHLRKKHARR
jgi:AbrB family looped-hinge helix DNA binding protein